MNAYKILNKQVYSKEEFEIKPIRYQDRHKIMQWRNEQMYHLRQAQSLTKEIQESYFNTVIAKLFEEEKPNQILFSYLKNDECIGYGGLVHINWIDQNAEISFIIKTELEQSEFKKHWGIYLDLIEQVAFQELKLHKIFTYAFDLRSHLYDAVEEKEYTKEAVLKEHCLFNGQYLDVIIHSKIKQTILVREMNDEDKEITYLWASDPLTRSNSFSTKPIEFQDHSSWFDKKLEDQNAIYFIVEFNEAKAGLVRFDYNKEKQAYIIGITIDDKFRGKKLSSLFIEKACKNLLKEKKTIILAYIKKENKSSIKAFERAGFILQEEEMIKRNKSLRYIYGN